VEYELRRKAESSTSARWRLLDQYRPRAWLPRIKGRCRRSRGRNACQAEARLSGKKHSFLAAPPAPSSCRTAGVVRDLPLITPDGIADRRSRPRSSPFSSATLSRHLQTGNMPSTSPRTAARAGPQRARPHPTIAFRLRAHKKFLAAFDAFTTLCRTAINPTLSVEAVEEMLTSTCSLRRLFGTVFSQTPSSPAATSSPSRFEKVIDRPRLRPFRRADFSANSNRFYSRSRTLPATIDDFSEKQKFLNTVYEEILPRASP